MFSLPIKAIIGSPTGGDPIGVPISTGGGPPIGGPPIGGPPIGGPPGGGPIGTPCPVVLISVNISSIPGIIISLV